MTDTINYYDVKERLPEIGLNVRVFFEDPTVGGHGLWWRGVRISETHFQLGSDKSYIVPIDTSNRQELGIGVTHWAGIDYIKAPNLCRLHNGNCV